MVKMDDAVLARFKKNELNFEIYVDPFMAWDYKHGKNLKIEDLVAYEAVYADAKKGEEASKDDLNEVFGTNDFFEIAKQIILHGDVQLTTVQKQQMTENRENEIINFIKTNAHDPKNKTPVPEQRIRNAFEELKIKVNLNKTKDKEIEEILDKLKRIMPISLEKIIVTVEIPSSHAGKASGTIYKYELAEQKWLANGSFVAKIKIASGLKNQLVSELNNITHGNLVLKVEEDN